MASLSCELDGTENHPAANPPGPLPVAGRLSQPTGCDQDSVRGLHFLLLWVSSAVNSFASGVFGRPLLALPDVPS